MRKEVVNLTVDYAFWGVKLLHRDHEDGLAADKAQMWEPDDLISLSISWDDLQPLEMSLVVCYFLILFHLLDEEVVDHDDELQVSWQYLLEDF